MIMIVDAVQWTVRISETGEMRRAKLDWDLMCSYPDVECERDEEGVLNMPGVVYEWWVEMTQELADVGELLEPYCDVLGERRVEDALRFVDWSDLESVPTSIRNHVEAEFGSVASLPLARAALEFPEDPSGALDRLKKDLASEEALSGLLPTDVAQILSLGDPSMRRYGLELLGRMQLATEAGSSSVAPDIGL